MDLHELQVSLIPNRTNRNPHPFTNEAREPPSFNGRPFPLCTPELNYSVVARSTIGKRSSQPDSHSRTIRSGGRLANIFMPYAARQRRALFEKEPDQTHARLIHYTTAESAISIIRSKRFRMRNTIVCPTIARYSTATIFCKRSFLTRRSIRILQKLWTCALRAWHWKPLRCLMTGGLTFDLALTSLLFRSTTT